MRDLRVWLSRAASYMRRFRSLRRNAILYLISNTIQSMTAGALGVVYTLFLSSLGYGDAFIGLTLFVGAVGGGAGILPASVLTRRYGWRTMLLWSDLIGGVAIAIQLLFPTPVITLLTTLGVGASVAIFLVLNAPFLAAQSAPHERAALFGLNNGLGFLAAVVGALLGGALPVWLAAPVLDHSGLLLALRPWLLVHTQARLYQEALLVMGALAVPSIIPVVFLRDTPAQPAAETSLAVASAAPTSQGVKELQLPEEAAKLKKRWPDLPDRARLRKWLGDARTLATGVIGRFSLSQLLVGFGAGLFFPYLNLYFVNQVGISVAAFGALSAGLTVLQAPVSLLSAPLADRYGKVRASLLAQVASLPFLLTLGLAPIALIASAAYLIRGALMTITSAPLQAYLMEVVPTEQRIVASNVYNVSWQVAWAIGAGLGGVLIALGGYAAPVIVAAVCYALSAALLARWFLRRAAPIG
ncbi:MAG TPA: MFS transporter [Ktedonobacterales bacterium]|nr:MFS transporter [Ktedonobacterales bacterium]